MKTLNRPMFKYGGPIKEGVMSGIKERVPFEKGGSYIKNLTGALANFYNPIKKAKPIQKIIQKIKPTIPPKRVPSGTGMGGVQLTKDQIAAGMGTKGVPFMERAGRFVRQNPIYSGVGLGIGSQYGLDALKGGANLLEKGVLQVGDLLVRDKYFDQDKYMKENYPDGFLNTLFGGGDKPKIDPGGPKGPPSIINPPGGKKGGSDTPPPPGVQLTDKEKRAQQIQKYRDIMDIKGMNKEAAYDSLIAASAAVNQAGGDLKGAIKDGSLINQIIQSTSKAFDKPKKTKDAIDTLILKGEIEKDIKASDPSAKLLNEYRLKQMEKIDKDLNTGFAEAKIAASKNLSGQAAIDAAASVASNNYKGNIITKSQLTDVMEAAKGSGEISEEQIIISATQEVIKGKNLPDGDYTVGDVLVTITEGQVTDIKR